MTQDEILAMKPGRELDALVAHQIFGVRDPDPRWSPSMNIYAAWEVEEEINKRNLRVAYCQALQIVIRSQKDYVTTFDYVHASPADRCKAALLAVMEG